MIFPDRQAVLGFNTFLGNAGANHLRQPIDVDCFEPHSGFDVVTHRLGPGFSTEDADLQ